MTPTTAFRPRSDIYPAIRTVSPVPQKIADMTRLMTLIATIDVRIARPTATPTPAGPPDA